MMDYLNYFYDYMIQNKKISINKMKEIGLSDEDITNLINQKEIEKIDDFYVLANIKGLYLYGISLLKNKDYDKAYICFRECFNISPNDLNTCFKLFLLNIKNHKYLEAFNYFNKIYHKNKTEFNKIVKIMNKKTFDNELFNEDNYLYIYYLELINYIEKKDIANINKSLDKYLEYTNKKYLTVIILYLIKISVIKNDNSYVYNFLDNIRRENFRFDISIYINNYYEAIENKKIEEAKIYLNIIKESNKLGYSSILVDKLEEELSNEIKLEENSDLKQLIKLNRILRKKLKMLDKNSIILIDLRNSKDEKIFTELLENTNNVKFFVIEMDDKKKLVVRKFNNNENDLSIEKLKELGNKAYIDNDYDLCIEYYQKILNNEKVNPGIYAKIGLAYMKKDDNETAINYLTIADYLSEKDKMINNYSNLIDTLKGKIPYSNYKPWINIRKSDFKNDLNDSYKIENIEKIKEYIKQGTDIIELIEKYNLTEEQINFIYISLAREYYSKENYGMGDKYLKKVERSKNKSKKLSKTLNETIKNKKFYKNRIS